MFKKCIVLFLAVCFLTTPAFAAGQKLPTWLAETGATPVSDAKLELVQGEIVPWAAVAAGLTLTVIAYLYYKHITGKPFTGPEKTLWKEIH